MLIESVTDISALDGRIKAGSANSFGVGGIKTKLDAASLVLKAGIPMILANGSADKILENLYNGTVKATLFSPK